MAAGPPGGQCTYSRTNFVRRSARRPKSFRRHALAGHSCGYPLAPENPHFRRARGGVRGVPGPGGGDVLKAFPHITDKPELKAEPLAEVLHYDERELGILKAVWDEKGALEVLRPSPTVALPEGPEECDVCQLWNYRLCAPLCHSKCDSLKDLGPQLWKQYLDHPSGGRGGGAQGYEFCVFDGHVHVG